MGSCELQTKHCCSAKALKAGASGEPQPALRAQQRGGEALFGGGRCCKTCLKGHVLKGWSLERGRRLWPFCRTNWGTRSRVEHGSVLVFGVGMAPGRGFLHPLRSLPAEDGEFSAVTPQRAERLLEVTLNKEKCRIALHQSYARIVCLLMFWLPDQGLHSLRVCHCSRLKAWCVLIAKLLRTHCFSCGLKIPPKLFKTARGHLQTFQWNTFLFFFFFCP